jgi:hypothetical protein
MFTSQSPDGRRIKTTGMRLRADLAQYGNSQCSVLGQYGNFLDFVTKIA